LESSKKELGTRDRERKDSLLVPWCRRRGTWP
jgi:hypothetical protein